MKPENWNGYAYPEYDKKLWISFSSGPGGQVITWISKYDLSPVNGSRDIPVYRAVTGDWKNQDEVIENANAIADAIIKDGVL